jgi:hypothetical protein
MPEREADEHPSEKEESPAAEEKATPEAAEGAESPKKADPSLREGVPSTKRSTGLGWNAGSRKRRLAIAVAIYVACVAVFAVVAGPARLSQHTAYNHYAHLADAWIHGRQDLRNGPPSYAQGNDFALYQGKWYISFPPFPAALMVPLVALAGSPENFQDGQFIVWLAGVGPALLFLVLEKLRATGRSQRTEKENVVLALLFAFGTVYFFTAVQGTVWFAAHVVGVGVTCAYLFFAIDAERPWLAGLMLALAWLTRPPVLLAAPLFALEAVRVCCPGGLPSEGSFMDRVEATWQRVDKRAIARKVVPFALPILGAFALMAWMNATRFDDPSPFAPVHQYLTVVWKARMEKWGLFGIHYLSKNLGVMLTILPWLPAKAQASAPGTAPFVINEHGLALWFTTPLYFWLFRPKEKSWLYGVLAVAVLGPLVMDLLYQNSGWRQFGYRFSNDYSPLLFVMLALGARPMGRLFKAAAAWSVAWCLFGAISFDRAEYDRYYWREGSQTLLYQPD